MAHDAASFGAECLKIATLKSMHDIVYIRTVLDWNKWMTDYTVESELVQ